MLMRKQWETDHGQCVILFVQRVWAAHSEDIRRISGRFLFFLSIIYTPLEVIHFFLYNGFFNRGQVVFIIIVVFFLLFGVVESDGFMLVANDTQTEVHMNILDVRIILPLYHRGHVLTVSFHASLG